MPVPWPSGISRPAPSGPDPLRSSLVPDLRAPVSPPGAHPVEVIVAQPEEELESILRQLRLLIAVSWIVTSVLSAAGLTWVVRRGLSPWRTSAIRSRARGNQSSTSRSPCPGPPSSSRRSSTASTASVSASDLPSNESTTSPPTRPTSSGRRSPASGPRWRSRSPASGIPASTARASRRPSRSRPSSSASSGGCWSSRGRPLRAPSCGPSGSSSASSPWRAGPRTATPPRERGVLLEISIDPGLQITSDRQLLGRVLQNLLENLGNYADEGTMARLAATSRGDQVAVIVENDCAGLDEELVRHAFDAFGGRMTHGLRSVATQGSASRFASNSSSFSPARSPRPVTLVDSASRSSFHGTASQRHH